MSNWFKSFCSRGAALISHIAMTSQYWVLGSIGSSLAKQAPDTVDENELKNFVHFQNMVMIVLLSKMYVAPYFKSASTYFRITAPDSLQNRSDNSLTNSNISIFEHILDNNSTNSNIPIFQQILSNISIHCRKCQPLLKKINFVVMAGVAIGGFIVHSHYKNNIESQQDFLAFSSMTFFITGAATVMIGTLALGGEIEAMETLEPAQSSDYMG